MRITETETESELKQVEQTTTVEKIKCDVCGHTYTDEEWSGNEFAINPGIEREFHSIQEVDDLFDAYHVDVPTHVVDDGYTGHEMSFTAQPKTLLEALNEEIPIAMEMQEQTDKTLIAKAGLKEEYADKIGTHNFYLKDQTIHHFMYRLNIEESAEDHKHVCDDCYNVVFD